MKINEYEAGMLDAILEAFGNSDSISREQLLEIFDSDESLANALVTMLIDSGLVNGIGYTEQDELPILITREPKAVLFIKKGGFTAQYKAAETQTNNQKETERLQKENLLLQNEKMKYEQSLREKDERIKDLELKNKRFELLKNVVWLFGIMDIGLIIWLCKFIFK